MMCFTPWSNSFRCLLSAIPYFDVHSPCIVAQVTGILGMWCTCIVFEESISIEPCNLFIATPSFASCTSNYTLKRAFQRLVCCWQLGHNVQQQNIHTLHCYVQFNIRFVSFIFSLLLCIYLLPLSWNLCFGLIWYTIKRIPFQPLGAFYSQWQSSSWVFIRWGRLARACWLILRTLFSCMTGALNCLAGDVQRPRRWLTPSVVLHVLDGSTWLWT